MGLFLAFLAVPVIEIMLFIKVGGLIGLWPTLGIVVATAVIGTAMVRHEGARAMADLRRSLGELSDPSRPLAHGAMILVSGVLLLTPGFFTDAVGLLLLIPAVRDWAMRQVAARVQVQGFQMGGASRMGPGFGARPSDPDVIDAEEIEAMQRERPQGPGADGPGGSGWTRH